MNLRPGDLVFVRGTTWFEKAIEDITSSQYSHVAGIVKENELIEAQGFRKTGYQGLDCYYGQSDIFTCAGLSDEQRQAIIECVLSEVGTRYDYILILWEAVRYLLHKVFPYKETKRRICSTLWADAYKAAGIDLCPGIRYPSPEDLAQSKLLKKIGSY
ncbi:hypothetical protein LSG31_13020 [Fodinisporobacter ferrooxydans]|uniref:Uncharacterized protein n=1 Tax=Fodinisporobacter ferrooxydans TaxID=2901836 RepID=A0ABY4CEB0_9BACL|nr:hypothetical protein LSG31_13020 [Alicyclobacillaceae bacterium MYW30-H2]